MLRCTRMWRISGTCTRSTEVRVVPVLIPRVVAPVTRADNVLKAVQDALDSYRGVINADVDFRSVQIDVKLDKGGTSVRAVVITTQGELPRR